MKRLGLFYVLLVSLLPVMDIDAAPRTSRPGANSNATANSATNAPVSAARAGVRRATVKTTGPVATGAASGTAVTGTVSKGRAATSSALPNAAPKVVGARAATQKVVNNGTKVSTATKNTVVNSECQQKFEGCMDSFCMLDNTTGGRCICSDKNAELNKILAEIEKLDQQSYNMATVGVERIEMGENADAVMKRANSVANSIKNSDAETNTTKRKTLDLSAWNTDFDEDDTDLFAEKESIESKEGDALYSASISLCKAQIPECAADMSMLTLMYAQKIKSDCNAYENTLKQQKTQSANKLATAEKALREASLEQIKSANKYDLGQCTIQFKQCMANTAGCGDDFTGCVGIAAAENATVKTGGKVKAKQYTIKGTASSITIASSTYDTLEAKKVMCESVTKQCVNVKDKVWNAFLRDIAPTIKTAELLAESNLRTNCISNIATCFQKACKDNIDPSNPDGSYDMCLANPDTLRSLCKVEIDPCEAAEPGVMDYVKARLASMRVDSCTKELKECLQSEDRCGSDYTQCVGLANDDIVKMCPQAKLVACNDKSGKREYSDEEYENLISGLVLNIDNNMLTKCQNALNEAMVKACGDADSCSSLAKVDGVGGASLQYKFCQIGTDNCVNKIDEIPESSVKTENWEGKITGMIDWSVLDIDSTTGRIQDISDEDIAKLAFDVDDSLKKYVKSETQAVINAAKQALSLVESDANVQYCMTGRKVKGVTTASSENSGRFANLTSQVSSTIAMDAITAAKEVYTKKYNELLEQREKDAVAFATKKADIMKNGTTAERIKVGSDACRRLIEGYDGGSNNVSCTGDGTVSMSCVGKHGDQNNWDHKYKADLTATFDANAMKCTICVHKYKCQAGFAYKKKCGMSRWKDDGSACNDYQY